MPTYDACFMRLASCLLGGLNDLLGNDFAVRSSDASLFHLTGHAFLDKVPEAETDLGDVRGGNGRREPIPHMRRNN